MMPNNNESSISPEADNSMGHFMSEWINDLSHNERLNVLRMSGMFIKFIKEKTEEMCLIAVKQDGLALAFIDDQTEEICLAAIRQNRNAYNYVKNKTDVIMREMLYSYVPLDWISISNYGHLFRSVDNDVSHFSDDVDAVNSLFGSSNPTIQTMLISHIDSELQKCDICLEKNTRMGYRLIPCEHDTICIDCLSKLRQNLCPFCRAEITDVIRI